MEKIKLNELEKLACEIKELENFADEITASINEKKEEIKKIMKEENETDVRTDIFHIVWNVVLSDYFNKSECKKMYPEIIEKFTTKKESRPLKIL